MARAAFSDRCHAMPDDTGACQPWRRRCEKRTQPSSCADADPTEGGVLTLYHPPSSPLQSPISRKVQNKDRSNAAAVYTAPPFDPPLPASLPGSASCVCYSVIPHRPCSQSFMDGVQRKAVDQLTNMSDFCSGHHQWTYLGC